LLRRRPEYVLQAFGVGTRENKLLLKQLHETGFPAGPQALDSFYAPNFVAHVSGWSDLAGLKETLRIFIEAFPNSEWAVQDMVAEGDKVAVRIAVKIRSATGVSRALSSTSIYRFANNVIAEQWGNGDSL
jgi:predicted ester cyclase